jgi:hypothetical protein
MMANEMVNTASQFPWASVVTAAAGIIGAFGGALLTNFFSEKRWDKQVQHEQSKEKRKFLQTKGEETFQTFKKWENELFFYNASRIGYLQGAVTKEYMMETIDMKVTPETHIKLNTLISLYFDELSDDYDLIRKQVALVNESFQKSSQCLPNIAGANRMIHEAQVYQRQFEHFERKLKLAIKNT